jgi:uncharacterized coiled-coil protein SlyX
MHGCGTRACLLPEPEGSAAAVQAEKEAVVTKQHENRALLRQEERLVHKHQTQLVSLRSSLADKAAEVAALGTATDPARLADMQAELAKVERQIKQGNEGLAEARKQLARLQAQLEELSEALTATRQLAVRPMNGHARLCRHASAASSRPVLTRMLSSRPALARMRSGGAIVTCMPPRVSHAFTTLQTYGPHGHGL